jgi:hypothetical protein
MSIIGNRSQYFRHIYSNGFGLQTGGNEVILSFGFKDNPQAKDEEITNEVAVVMLPSTLKFLARSLTKLVDFIEKTGGTEIPIDETKLTAMDQAYSEAISATASLPPT